MIEPLFTQDYENDTYTASVKCSCGRVTSASVNAPDLFKYRQGAFVQDAFPYLSPEDREALFVTGICADCWNTMFGDDEDE